MCSRSASFACACAKPALRLLATCLNYSMFIPKLNHSSHAPALVFIHNYLRDTVVPAGMPESRHRDVKLSVGNPAPIRYRHNFQVTVHGTGYRHPCRYDDSETYLCITMSAPAWEFRLQRSGVASGLADKSIHSHGFPTLERLPLHSHAGASLPLS